MKRKLLSLLFAMLLITSCAFLLTACGDMGGGGGGDTGADKYNITFPTLSASASGSQRDYSVSLISVNVAGETINNYHTSPAKINKGTKVYLRVYFGPREFVEKYDMDTFKIVIDTVNQTKTLTEEDNSFFYSILIEESLSRDHSVDIDLSELALQKITKSIALEFNQNRWCVRNDNHTNGSGMDANGEILTGESSDRALIDKWNIEYKLVEVVHVDGVDGVTYRDYERRSAYTALDMSQVTYANREVTLNFQIPKITDCSFAVLLKMRYDEKYIYDMSFNTQNTKILADKNSDNNLTATIDDDCYANYAVDLFGSSATRSLKITCPQKRMKFAFSFEQNHRLVELMKVDYAYNDINKAYNLYSEKLFDESQEFYIGQTVAFKTCVSRIEYENQQGGRVYESIDNICNFSNAKMYLNESLITGNRVENSSAYAYSVVVSPSHLSERVSRYNEPERCFNFVMKDVTPTENGRKVKIITFESNKFQINFKNYNHYERLPLLSDGCVIVPTTLTLNNDIGHMSINVSESQSPYYGKTLNTNFALNIYINGTLLSARTLGNGVTYNNGIYSVDSYLIFDQSNLPANLSGKDYIELKFEETNNTLE